MAVVATAAENRHRFDIPPGEIEPALKQFSAVSGRPVIVPSELISGLRTLELRGEFTAEAALDRLLTGTPLMAALDRPTGTFAIVSRPPPKRHGPLLNAAAFVVIGLAADAEQARRFHRQAAAIREGLVARGIPNNAITTLPATPDTTVRRDTLLAALRAAKRSLDETWLILLGNAALAREGSLAFQVSGPRLTADDLAAATGALPGRKYVVISTARSGGFLAPLLALPNTEAVAATAASGQVNEPRFAEMWAKALAQDPGASFRELAAGAAARVESFYRRNQLGQPEQAQILDRAVDAIVEVGAATPVGTAPQP